jgi:hypothetical protein
MSQIQRIYILSNTILNNCDIVMMPCHVDTKCLATTHIFCQYSRLSANVIQTEQAWLRAYSTKILVFANKHPLKFSH